LVAAVEAGLITVKAAAAVAGLPHDRQMEVVAARAPAEAALRPGGPADATPRPPAGPPLQVRGPEHEPTPAPEADWRHALDEAAAGLSDLAARAREMARAPHAGRLPARLRGLASGLSALADRAAAEADRLDSAPAGTRQTTLFHTP
jgi:hypothetical protein